MKHILPTLLVFALALISGTVEARQLRICDAVIPDVPQSWSVDSSTACNADLKKRFVYNGYWYDEWISIQAATDNYDNLQGTLDDLYNRYNFRLVDRERLNFAKMSAPFWFMYRSGQNGEAIWLALVLHQGLTYSIEMRTSTLDVGALTEFGEILERFDFLPDDREDGWTALSFGNASLAEHKFAALLDKDPADANARYGYGLALLAQGRVTDATTAIERARPQLGVSEDVRRALGRAALERGQASRAGALWIQVMRDNPAWEQEMRPWVLAAILQATPQAPAPQHEDIKAVSTDGGKLLYILQAVDLRMMHGEAAPSLSEQSFNAVRFDLSDRLSNALNATVANSGEATELPALLAAVDLERGAKLASTLFEKWDDDNFYRAELLIANALRDIGAVDEEIR